MGLSGSGGPLDLQGIRWRIVYVRAGAAPSTVGPTLRPVYIPGDVIEDAVKRSVFDGSFLNHPTAPPRSFGERDLATKIGAVSEVCWSPYAFGVGAAVGTLHLFDEALRARVLAAYRDGMLETFMGFSLWGPCSWAVEELGDYEFDVVTCIRRASVDLVEDAAAGGGFLLDGCQALAASRRRP